MYTITDNTVQGQKVLRLAGDGQALLVAPALGANWFSWVVEETELFAPYDLNAEGTKYGTPVLFPTPNRVRDARYSWQGKEILQRKNGKPRVIHGLVYDAPFEEVERREGDDVCSVTLRVEITGGELLTSYPFPCRLDVGYTLSADGPRVDYEVTNLGEEAMPYGFALHPYFAKLDGPEDCLVKMPAPFVHEADEEKFPSGRVNPVAGTYYDLSRPRPVSQAVLDHVYWGMKEGDRAWVLWRKSGLAASVTASAEFDHMVVFTPRERPCICLENQTCSTDAVNRHNAGHGDTAHVLVLEPGRSAGGWVRFAAQPWSPHEEPEGPRA